METTTNYQEHIDYFLEKYLILLDEYTTLRSKLSTHSTSLYQNIARANFSAERGLRYGQDQYDQRMQATRRIIIQAGDESVASVEVVHDASGGLSDEVMSGAGEPKGDETSGEMEEDEEESERMKEDEEKKAKMVRSKDPLRWFGVLTPATLRAAQGEAVVMVEDVIPRLVEVNKEMERLEIEVRRARKKRGKVEGQGHVKSAEAMRPDAVEAK